MQRRIRSGAWARVLALAAGVLAGAWLAGCSTAAYKQGDKTANAAQAAALQVQTENQALATALAALKSLVDQPAADLKPQFQAFNTALEKLVAVGKRTDAAVSHLARDHAAFIAGWDKQLTTITNADVRSRSEARKTEVSNQFAVAHQRCLQAQEALRPLLGYLQDVRKAISADLNPGGLEAVKGLVGNTNTTASKVQTGLTQAIAELKALNAAMSSVRQPAAS